MDIPRDVTRVGAGGRDEGRSTALLERKQTHFLLWRPRFAEQTPALFFGRFVPGQGVDLAAFRELELGPSPISADLFELPAAECGLLEGGVYLYWFKIRDASVPDATNVLYCTDPFAWAVDRSTLAPAPPDGNGVTVAAPASIVAFRGGRLVPSDLDGRPIQPLGVTDPSAARRRASNNRLVIYELPTRWTGASADGTGTNEVGTGTFADVSALIVAQAAPPSFPDLTAVSTRAHLIELGINALELLPPADSPQDLEWGYGTSNYFAADFELGRPAGEVRSRATFQLQQLVQDCHGAGIRFFPDVVMAFTRDNPSRLVSFTDLLVEPGKNDPAEFRSTDHGSRAGFGGNPFRYFVPEPRRGFDPVTGRDVDGLVPARQYMKTFVSHWLQLYGIDGVRVDDIADIDNWDFNREFTQHARAEWQAARGDAARFLVISEELGRPAEFVRSGGTDAAWNEPWKRIARSVLLGKNAESENEPSFERSVRMLVDCRERGFSDLAQAVNYLGSHDVGGFRNERIFNFLVNNGVTDAARRLKLGYALLLTAVGIPMIFAGDEFADSQDLPLTDVGDRNKQIDPVNFSRLNEPWRRELFAYVARLVRLRTSHDALALNDTRFLHTDFNDKRVLVWQRGLDRDPVVVVANFSDFGSAGGLAGQYVIPNFPRRDAEWFEVSQSDQHRRVAPRAIGNEPLFPWEAKVYVVAPN